MISICICSIIRVCKAHRTVCALLKLDAPSVWRNVTLPLKFTWSITSPNRDVYSALLIAYARIISDAVRARSIQEALPSAISQTSLILHGITHVQFVLLTAYVVIWFDAPSVMRATCLRKGLAQHRHTWSRHLAESPSGSLSG